MAPKASKKTKVIAESESEEESPSTIDVVTAMMKTQNKELSDKIMSAMRKLEDKLDQSIAAIPLMEKRIQDVESVVQVKTDLLEERMSKLEASNKNLLSRLVNLEGRSRRHNIRILGVKEGIEKGMSPVTVFTQLLTELLGKDVITGDLLLDRAHRIPSPKQMSGDRPRVVIVCCHYFHQKEQIIQAARRKKDLSYQGQPVRLVEDLCPEVITMRRKFHSVMELFFKEGLKPVMQYPARLRIVLKDGQRRFFNSEQQARDALPAIIPGFLVQSVPGMS